MCRGSRRHADGANATTRPERRESSHGSNQRLADRDHISLGKKPTESFPVLFVAQRVSVRSHGLVHIHSQGSVELFRNSRDFRQTQVVRFHHHSDDGHRNAQLYTTLSLLVNECPIARTALRILLGFGWIIERELDVMKRTQFIVLENSNAVAVGSDGELDRLRVQVGEYRLEVGVHAVLTGAKIY